MSRFALLVLLLLPWAVLAAWPQGPEPASEARANDPFDPADWPMYNRDVVGTRHNPVENRLSAANVGQLTELWRFPAAESKDVVGTVHGTPVVTKDGVYFGTVTHPAFYKLSPEGKLLWTYRNPDEPKPPLFRTPFTLPTSGFVTSPLVVGDTVYAVDLGGFIFALDAATGQERWKINTRVAPFPGGHPSNCLFAAPTWTAGLLIVAGGGFEHGVAANPIHHCCDGRGFVAALEPATGRVVWKYDVGPDPKPLEPPVKIVDSYGEHVFHMGPSTSSVWCVPGYDAETGLLYFGTDAHNAPRQPTSDDPRLYTVHSCAVIALDARTGAEKWVTQVNSGDVWNYAMRAYDPETGLYKDQSIGDTPKLFRIQVNGVPTKVVGCGCKNGVFYLFDAATGRIVAQTPQYKGPPSDPPDPPPHPRTLALPGPTGGLQTGCATDGQMIFTNGIDHIMLNTGPRRGGPRHAPTGGRVVALSLDLNSEVWRHERPKVAAVGGTADKPAFTNVGDPVGSGIAVANGVLYFTTTVSNQLVALEAATGKVLKEISLGPVWSGPAVARGRVYVGLGNILFSPGDPGEAYYRKSMTGGVVCFGLRE
ncbi:MAG TPA: PQQ-binding-like beta-propeller repeat protein [Gemmatales bacterium]|nr:PQQ-binding-like beta-propeller repeat protein [Gemmatales bacterium]HMP60208.1 PQQ-binding-like beta-propeller repeat protein [Gemmatales bacterium]